MANIIEFNRFRELRGKKGHGDEIALAYKWAVAEQRQHGLISQPIRLKLDDGDFLTDRPGFTVSVFYDEESQNAIMRRDWDDGFVVQYNNIVNYDEFLKDAPNTNKKLLENGVKLSKTYKKVFKN